MANNNSNVKWTLETTIKFIQYYKIHECLWNFSSPDYKNKVKRNAALIAIMREMGINDFGLTEVKNKIKNLRSTYSQEMKKIEDSKKSGAGLDSVYVSNIKWLKEMEEVFRNDLKRKSYENIQSVTQIRSHQSDVQQQSDLQQVTASAQASDLQPINDAIITPNYSASATPPRPKKRSREIVKAINDLKTMHDKINTEEEETLFDVFGKSVAMQLKKLSVENALRAQQKIQCILTEIGITDYRERTASSLSNYSNQSVETPASNYSSYDERLTPDTYQISAEDSSNTVYSYLPQTEASTQIIPTNDILHSAMAAAFVSNDNDTSH